MRQAMLDAETVNFSALGSVLEEGTLYSEEEEDMKNRTVQFSTHAGAISGGFSPAPGMTNRYNSNFGSSNLKNN